MGRWEEEKKTYLGGLAEDTDSISRWVGGWVGGRTYLGGLAEHTNSVSRGLGDAHSSIGGSSHTAGVVVA